MAYGRVSKRNPFAVEEENLVRFAVSVFENDPWHFLGSTGVGAVMGSWIA